MLPLFISNVVIIVAVGHATPVVELVAPDELAIVISNRIDLPTISPEMVREIDDTSLPRRFPESLPGTMTNNWYESVSLLGWVEDP